MSGHIGTLGAMSRIGCVASLSSDSVRASSEVETIGGRRFATLAPRPFRSWRLSTGSATRPGEMAPLSMYARGEFGPGPFWWLDSWAKVTNVLDPRDTALPLAWGVSSTRGGPVVMPDGVTAPAHIIAPDNAWQSSQSLFGGGILCPVVPGEPVTISAYVSQVGTRIQGVFADAGGATVGGTASAAGDRPGWHRVSVTVDPPAGAARVTLSMSGGGAIALPAVTWSRKLLDFHVGQGARNVVVTGESFAATVAHQGSQFGSQSYEVMEVG